MDKKLLKKLLDLDYKRSKNDDFSDGIGGTVPVYTVETENVKCKIWNSSNNSSFDVAGACGEIAKRILDDDEDDLSEGRISMGFKEIWFEIEEK